MNRIRAAIFAAFLAIPCLSHAETVELVTYFPAGGGSGGLDPQFNSLRVGDDYQNTAAPADGIANIADALTIGVPAPGLGAAIVPAGALQVVGAPGQADRVLFQAGPSGTMSLAVGLTDLSSPAVGSALTLVSRTADGAHGMIHARVNDPVAGGIHHRLLIARKRSSGDNAWLDWTFQVNAGDQPALTFFRTDRPDVGAPQTVIPLRIGYDGSVAIGSNNPPNDPSSLVIRSNQGGSLELGGTDSTANPVTGGMPYIDFHFGRLAGVAQDLNARLINRADGILDVQTSTGGAAAQTRLSIGNNLGVGTTTPQTTSPENGVNSGNLDANDVFIRSTGQWVSQGGAFPAIVMAQGNGVVSGTNNAINETATFNITLPAGTWVVQAHVQIDQDSTPDLSLRINGVEVQTTPDSGSGRDLIVTFGARQVTVAVPGPTVIPIRLVATSSQGLRERSAPNFMIIATQVG